MFFAIKNQTLAQQEDQARRQDQLALLHEDIAASWDAIPPDIVTTTLDNQQGSGNAAGQSLDSGVVLPPSFLEAPQ